MEKDGKVHSTTVPRVASLTTASMDIETNKGLGWNALQETPCVKQIVDRM